MRTSNYKKIKFTKSAAKKTGLAVGAILLAGIIFFFSFFHVTHVEVMENTHYSKKELKKMILTGAFSSNSILAPITCSKAKVENVPYVESYSVSRSGRNSIVIGVKEKNVVGCIPYLDSYIYFDRNGKFIESSRTRDESVPYFEGITVKKTVMNEKLPIKDAVLNTAVALSTIFAKNDMTPDYIELDEDYSINLIYGDMTVKLGKDRYLEDKMNRTIAILPQITGEKGILHMENGKIEGVRNHVVIFPASHYVTTPERIEQAIIRIEKELDYAKENWIGGYDEEGDYTGSGEYDADLNYVGAEPTQELIDSFGDWKGGYNESGGFDGVSEYDRDGNYVGPMPDNAGSSGTDSTDSSDESENDNSDETDEDQDYSEDDSYSDESDGEYDGWDSGYSDESDYE